MALPTLRTVDGAFVAELDSLGFFRFARPSDKEEAKRQIVERRYPLLGQIGRDFPADGEDLAEGGVRDLLGHVAPFLRSEGVRIEAEYRPLRAPVGSVVPSTEPNPYPGPTLRLRLSLEPGGDLVDFTEDPGPDAYRLLLGAEEIVFDSDWAEATTQTVALLDRLLAGHDSAESAWVLYGGGNEGILWFVTDAQAALLNSALPDRDRLSKVAT